MSSFANDSFVYLKKFNLDGIDIDWEFPTWSPDGHKTDRARFPLLLKVGIPWYRNDSTLPQAHFLDSTRKVWIGFPHYASSGRATNDSQSRLRCTFIQQVRRHQQQHVSSEDLLFRYVDLVQVMNYDYHIYSYFRPFVGFNAPLRRLKGELGPIGEMNSVLVTPNPQRGTLASDYAFRRQPWPHFRNWDCGATRR